MRLFLPFCFSLLLLTLLTSCGFHLRGSQGYQLEVSRVSVSAANAYGEFSRELERTLKSSGIEITNAADAEYLINVLSERTTRRPVATSSDISVAEYELRLETIFQVLDSAGEDIIVPTTLITERIYTFDRTSLVGNSEEEELLTEEMRRDIAGQLIRRFGATLRNRQSLAESEMSPNASEDDSGASSAMPGESSLEMKKAESDTAIQNEIEADPESSSEQPE